MKILFFVRRFYPSIGGVETHVLELSKRLVMDGHQVTVITELEKSQNTSNWHSDISSAISEGQLKGIKVYHIPIKSETWFKKFTIWRWLYKHKNLIKNTDIIHTHDVYFWYLPFRLLYPFKKSYVTFHGYETVFPPTKKAIRMRRMSARFATANLAVGEFIQKWYGTKANQITYGAIEPFYSKLNIAEKLTGLLKYKKNTKTKFLFVGRLSDDTAYPKYLQILDELKKKGVEFEFESVGDGDYRVTGEGYGKVHGWIKNVGKYIETTDILFASSYLVILEGLKYKKPIVSIYTNPLKKDYLQMTPYKDWIIIEEDVNKAVDKIYSGMSNKFTLLNFDKSYAWVTQQTWENLEQKYYTLWETQK